MNYSQIETRIMKIKSVTIQDNIKTVVTQEREKWSIASSDEKEIRIFKKKIVRKKYEAITQTSHKQRNQPKHKD